MSTRHHHGYWGAPALSMLLITCLMLTACNQTDRGQQDTELFPIYGITLGVTTEDELKSMGYAEDGHYEVHGQNFWVDSGIFDHMYVTRDSQLPLKWRNLGFDWHISYDDWVTVLEELGFDLTIEKPPSIGEYKDKPTFEAKIVAIKRDKVPTQLNLDFDYKHRTSRKDPGKLYSISIRIPKEQ